MPPRGPKRGAAVAKQDPDPAVEVAAVKVQDGAVAAAKARSNAHATALGKHLAERGRPVPALDPLQFVINNMSVWW